MQPKMVFGGLVVSLILVLGSNAVWAGPATAPYVKGELLVAFKEPPAAGAKAQVLTYGSRQTLQGLQAKGMLEEKGANLLSNAGATGVKAVARQQASYLKPDRSPRDWHQVYRVSFRKNSPVFKSRVSMRKFCETLSAEPGIEYAEPNYVGSLTAVPNDPIYPYQQQATFTQYGLETAWDVESGSPEMIIALIDSGMDLDHPDLIANLAVNAGELADNALDDDANGYTDDVYGWNFVDENGDVEDDLDHGTRVAGIIAARGNNSEGITGVCWQAKLLPIKVSSATGGLTVDRVVAAIQYAVARGAKVINLSLVFSGQSFTLKAACNSAANSAVIVAAAGNNGQNYVSMYPAGFEGVIGVAALDATGERAAFSNYNNPGINEWVDLAAPGTHVFTTYPLGLYDGDEGRGTSFAAPFVSGVAALLRAANPLQSPAAIRNHLQRTASKTVSFTTHGVINAAAALVMPLEPDLQVNGQNTQVIEFGASDGDQVLDPGERALVYFEIVNFGGDMLEDKSVTLSPLDPGITVDPISFSSTLPALKSGETSRRMLAPFRVEAASPASRALVTMQLDVVGLQTLITSLWVEDEADADVPQDVTSDLTLTSDKTWIVSGITSVATGATLTVEPWTTVKLEDDARLEVWGSLSSTGTYRVPIYWVNRTPPPVAYFQTSLEYPVGDRPGAVALGDVTADGYMDIVVANGGTSGDPHGRDMSVLAGDGAGGFASEVIYDVQGRPIGVALGDLTGDGITDIAIADAYGPKVRVLTGDGSGGFLMPEEEFTLGGVPHSEALSLALGDVTGDGLIDIIVSVYETDDVRVLAGDGAGGFILDATYAVGDGPWNITLGDATGDGRMDVVTANELSDNVSVLAGDGSGSFLPQVTYGVGDRPRGVVLGEVTYDGVTDIVVVNSYDHNVSVLEGDGAGGFFPHMTFAVGEYPRSVALGEVTGDEFVDIVTANRTQSNISVLPGDGSAIFLPQVTYGVGAFPDYVALGDVTGDGLPDVVTANSGSNDVSVLAGGGGIGRYAPQELYAVGNSPADVALGDVTLDGSVDIVTANYSDDVTVLPGDGSGGFLPQVTYTIGYSPYAVALGDVTLDGFIDIVTAVPGGDRVSVLANNGAGSFVPETTYAAGDFPRSIALGDVTGDGTIDIVTANGQSDDVTVLAGDGIGGFIPGATYAVGSGPYGVALANINGDSAMDIATANWLSGDVSVLLTDGAGGFLAPVTLGLSSSPQGLALGDVTNDGIPDIVTANYLSNSVSVLPGDGAGGFLAESTYAVGGGPQAVALEDVTGDGLTDIVSANYLSSEVSVLISDGAGGFLPQISYAAGAGCGSLALGDSTGDGIVDIVTDSPWNDQVSLLVGDGGSCFGQSPRIIAMPGSTVDIARCEFSLQGPVVLRGAGSAMTSTYLSTGGSALVVTGTVQVQSNFADSCVTGFVIAATAPAPSGLTATGNSGIGMLVHNASSCKAISNSQHGFLAFSNLYACQADLNSGIGLLALDTVENSVSTRSSRNGIQARTIEGSLAVSNAGIGLVASERITGCTAISNAQGAQAPLVEDSFILDSYGDGLAGVTDAIRVELRENYWISSDEVHFATSILANNAGDVDLDAVVGMYIAGNEGGGVDAGWTIPISYSTIIGNRGPGVVNNNYITSSNIAFNQGYGVVGGTVDGCFLKGNESGPTSGATVINPESSSVQTAKAFLLDVTPDEQTSLSVGFHTFRFTFSKPMRTSSLPLITHGPEAPYDYRVFQSLRWLSSTLLRARTYIDYNTPDGFHRIRLAGAASQDGFRIPPDTYHSFEVDLEGGLVINAAVAENTSEGILIKWTTDATNVARYEIYRSEDGGATWPEEPYITLSPSARWYLDRAEFLDLGKVYKYRVYEIYLDEAPPLEGGHDERTSAVIEYVLGAPPTGLPEWREYR